MPRRTNRKIEQPFESIFRSRQAGLFISEAHKRGMWDCCHAYDCDLSVDEDGLVCTDYLEANHLSNYVRYEWKGAGYGDRLKMGQRQSLTKCTHAMRVSPAVKKIALVLIVGNEATHVRDVYVTLEGIDDWTKENVFGHEQQGMDCADWEAWECRFLERLPVYYTQIEERRRRLGTMGPEGNLHIGLELSDMLAHVHEIGKDRDISVNDLPKINRLRNSGRSQP